MNDKAGSLSWQLLKAVLSIYFGITLVVTATQMTLEYLHTREMIRSELASIERTFYPALATALWEINHEQLDAIQRGITDLPSISAVRVSNPAGKVLAQNEAGHNLGNAIRHSFPVTYHFSGQEVLLAEVTFESSDDVVLNRVELGYKMILVSALIKSTALTLLFIWAFRRRLGQPLQRLTEAIAALDLDSLGLRRIGLTQTHDNELSRLEQAFNRMLTKLDNERREHDARLEAMNHNLEAQVRARTEELKTANRNLEKLARTDALTGAANRHHFVERAGIEILRAQRNGAPLCLLMIDLDHFKLINDHHGHPMGDKVLRNFAALAAAPLRAGDLLGRIGGEEFAILLPDTDLAGASEVADRILESVRRQRIEAGAEPIRYTVSIGAARLDPGSARFESLFASADAALYRAKAAGRDRLELDLPANPA